MATLKAIRRRIASVKSTQQITRAMKLVAAARLRRAQDALLNGRPYHEHLSRVAAALLASEPSALAAPEGAKQAALLVVVAADRGLCGAYNANVLRTAEEQAALLRHQGLEVRWFAVGRKVVDHFHRAKQEVSGQRINNTPRLATVELAWELAAIMLGEFRAGNVALTAVVYSTFRSVLSQRPTLEQVLPVIPPKLEGPAPDYLIEPSRAELVPVVMRSYVEASLLHALLEAEASEHAARMTAMDSATNNAVEMVERLTLEMNRARQAAITKELMDIVGGAEALRG